LSALLNTPKARETKYMPLRSAEEGTGAIGIFFDITDHKGTEVAPAAVKIATAACSRASRRLLRSRSGNAAAQHGLCDIVLLAPEVIGRAPACGWTNTTRAQFRSLPGV
jgi:hypothetical protein